MLLLHHSAPDTFRVILPLVRKLLLRSQRQLVRARPFLVTTAKPSTSSDRIRQNADMQWRCFIFDKRSQ